MSFEPKITKRLKELESNLTNDVCSEPGCGTSLLVEKEEKAAGRKARCIACLMRVKLRDSDRPKGNHNGRY